jgi:arylsulfatase A-like enzyme
MNFVIIVSDTFRRDHLGCYGNPWISTPHLDRLARQSVVFDQARVASFPTVPNRHDLMTGRFTFTYAEWQPLPPDEPTLAQVLSAHGYNTMYVGDTPHPVRDGYNYQRGFRAWEWIRGQENDNYRTHPANPPLPCDPRKLRSPHRSVQQYLRNVHERRYEEEYFVAQTMRRAGHWLEENYREKPFLLYVDTFDPHEPWDPPPWYTEMYDPGYEGDEVYYPLYGPADYLTGGELKHMRAMYAGECTLVDRWVGMLLHKVDDLGLGDDTLVLFTTDHGFYLGEHNLTGKSILLEDAGIHAQCPLYAEVSRVPLMVRPPRSFMGVRSQALVQAPDIMPTILELAGAEPPEGMNGISFAGILRGEESKLREVAVSSASIMHPGAAVPATVTDGEWTLITWGQVDENAKLTTKAVDHIERQHALLDMFTYQPELYRDTEDPNHTRNVISAHRAEADRLHAAYIWFLLGIGTTEERLAPRRRL